MSKKPWLNFADIKNRATFPQILAHYNMKIGKGDDYKINCPFHEDDRPSCSINNPKKIFHCFSCGEKGNILEFVQKMEGLGSLREGAYALQKIIGGETPEVNKKAKTANKPAKKVDEQEPDIIPDGYEYIGDGILRVIEENPEPLYETKDAEQSEDGVVIANKELTFELKLEPKHPFIQSRNFSVVDAKNFGIGHSNRGLMKNRICFPIDNKDGQLVGYAGRWAEETVPDDTARYLLPKNFEKSLELYLFSSHFEPGGGGADKAVVIVEGFWSAMYLSKFGIPAVAMMGNTLSQAQVDILYQDGRVELVIILMDGDEAGREHEAENLQKVARFLPVQSFQLYDGISPDEMDESQLMELNELCGSPSDMLSLAEVAE